MTADEYTTYVCLAFLPVLSSSFDWSHRLAAFAKIVKVLVSDHLRFDETLLEVAVDYTGGLWCQTAFLNGPAPDLFFTS